MLRSQRVPDAVITINDGHVFPVAAACRMLGFEPNVDIKIAGYDNSWMSAPERELEPTRPIVTVDKNNPQAGRVMVELLVGRIEKRISDQPHVRKIEPLLVFPSLDSTTAA
jgi:DNA-binding LacI/PurR family transcriptional regulator